MLIATRFRVVRLLRFRLHRPGGGGRRLRGFRLRARLHLAAALAKVLPGKLISSDLSFEHYCMKIHSTNTSNKQIGINICLFETYE